MIFVPAPRGPTVVPLATPRIPNPAAAAAAAAKAAWGPPKAAAAAVALSVPGAFVNLWAAAPNIPRPPRLAGGGVSEPPAAAPKIYSIIIRDT